MKLCLVLALLVGFPVNNLFASTIPIDVFKGQLEAIKPLFGTQPEQARNMLDSLMLVAQSQSGEHHEACVYLHQGRYHKFMNNFDKSLEFFSMGLPLAQKYSDDQLEAQFLRELGSRKSQTGETLVALEYYYSAIVAGKKAKDYRLVGACYSLIGNVFRVLGDYYKAIEYTLLAENNYRKAGFEEGAAWIQYTLAVIYADLQLYSEATNYLDLSLAKYEQVATESGDSLGIAICMDQYGKIQFENNDLIKARESFARSKNIYVAVSNTRGMSINLKNLGKVEYKLGNYEKTIELLTQANNINKAQGSPYGQASIYEYIGRSLYAKHEYQAAIDSLERGLQMAISTKQRPIQKDLYGVLANMYYEQGQIKTAFAYFTKQAALSDSLTEASANLKMAGLKNIYEMEQRRQLINELEVQNQITSVELERQQNIQLLLLIGGGIITLFLVIVMYLFNTKRKTLILVEQQRKELETLIATKDKFFSIIAHDLRGPLGIIMQTLSTFLEMFPDMSRDEIFDMLQSMENTSTKTFKLLENLLMWSRLQSGTLVATPESIDIPKQVKLAIDMHQERANTKGVELACSSASEFSAYVDPDMLSGILRNLISNAVKFTSAGDEIHVSIDRSSDGILVKVKDSGIGIPDSKLPHIFKVGNKFNRKGTSGEESSGLGLILVKEFVELQGGKIDIDSQEGQGTTVTLTIPEKPSGPATKILL